MDKTLNLAVNGGLMRGFKDNKNLLDVNATFVKEAKTKPIYRLFSINDIHPAMMRVETGGRAIAVEVWAVPPAGLATILLQEPPGLCIGKVRLADGAEVLGVVGESICCENSKDITQYGGWRNYIDFSK
ncbi:glutamyl-tRNA amidotransferase [Myxosarcina sp. GI1]|uniref:allophanate hydrolase-related protein n=1 Tax=Myxosarcina sp. GI1 TaxID=1541065 RepID=UPI00056A18E7|nr:glutamyl-tRNA amidotransferase [Myxosarcina sp. GI1]